MKAKQFLPVRLFSGLVYLLVLSVSSCNLIDSKDDNTTNCTSNEMKRKDFIITQNLLNVNNHYAEGNYIIFEYSNYVNQICPAKQVGVDCNVVLSYNQPRPVEVSLWISWGQDALQRIEKNNITGTSDEYHTSLRYSNLTTFTPNEWMYMSDAAIVTTKVRFKFESPYQDPNTEIVYLENLFISFKVSTYYYPY